MTLQWYPGHMHKAQKEMREVLPSVDLVIEVLDARIPFSSENPLIASIRGEKPVVKVLTKSDLADPDNIALWQSYLDAQRQTKTLAVSTQEPARIHTLPELCRKLTPEKTRGLKKLKAMIVGIPNVGKSTLINTLAGRAVAKTGNEPAVTKRQQTIHIEDDFVLLDTPGILWPKQEVKNCSYRLAFTGAIKDTALDYLDVALFGAEHLLAHYPERLKERYQIEQLPETDVEVLELIAARRGCLRAGGRADLNKVAPIFVNDFRSGTLGRISLELPDVVEKEVAEAKLLAEQKAERQAQIKAERRKRRRKNS
ncbi:ribosome biogenesis GTPase YlqF [Gilvimarinus agarilyticus]|uniref:ribosome biogenesis GTPase YlqF n=1 Tax=unclassified Gilvimarinus TaxID=2642066 RepID=UPI001C08EED1|nr:MULTISPECIES: ribosome biogenesis GTPase YlqF [unclassified Gilvimarinus]MBU2886473.1 ribosome biogenesis GTPase YlqF [Gilvimarinus agarilyticus]MDO6571152.1 ribosome biogenesis GTPase YlqF [Gilvimarinus sp. 2_MG-2023]MDO6748547.1 ribosome biogenesis GTPase YlqF [Gilvimarinus sp. 1_MG-2023]